MAELGEAVVPPAHGPVAPPPAAPEIPRLFIHVDANRNGNVDDAPAPVGGWRWGARGSGAVVLCNNDDDDASGTVDHSDNVVNGNNDVPDIAPLSLRRDRAAAFPNGWTAHLSVSDRHKLRIFNARTGAGAEVIGPGTGDAYQIPDLAPRDIAYGMEAVQYANGAWRNGIVRITLRVRDNQQRNVSVQHVEVRVAPWMMFHHLAHAQTVYVVNDASAENATFRGDLGPMVAAAGCNLVAHNSGDVWMQDCMEIGYSYLPDRGIHSVLRAPRNRPLRTFPRTLLGHDFGYEQQGNLMPYTTFDSFGNLEVSPPVQQVRGKDYPAGRIYYGPGRRGEWMDANLQAFLNAQTVQRPITVETGWLTVGHVDEVISFVPAPGGAHFKLLLASPNAARRILSAIPAAQQAATRMMVGRSFPFYNAAGNYVGERAAETDVATYLADAPARRFNAEVQRKLDRIKNGLRRQLGMDRRGFPDPNAIIELPVLYMRTPEGFADAMTAGVVNMLVINNHCIVPKPFGPVSGGVDLFEQDIRNKLTPLGLTVHFLDDWNTYHVALGEVHCGTNTKRQIVRRPWWEYQP